MFKRFIVSVLSLALIIFPFLCVSVSADSYETYNQDMIDLFSLQVNDRRIYNSSSSYSIPFSLDTYFVGYIEFTFFTDMNVTSIDISGKPAYFARNGEYYRVWSSPNEVYDNFTLNINGSYSNYIYLLTGEFCSSNRAAYDVNSDISLTTSSYSASYSYTGSPLNISGYPSVSGLFYGNYRIGFFISDWKLFDTIEFSLVTRCVGINSVSVGIADTYTVPYSVSIFDSSDLVYPTSDSYQLLNQRVFLLKISVDLRDLKLNHVNAPLAVYVSFDSLYENDAIPNICSINGIHGFLISDDIEPVVFWFRKTYTSLGVWFSDLSDKLSNLIDPDAPETDSAIQNAQDNIANIEQIESDYAADLDSSVISGQVDKVQNYGNALVFCSSILTRSFNNLGGYQIIYILPVCIGIFLFVASRARPIHVPKQREAPKANDNSVLDNSSG